MSEDDTSNDPVELAISEIPKMTDTALADALRFNSFLTTYNIALVHEALARLLTRTK